MRAKLYFVILWLSAVCNGLEISIEEEINNGTIIGNVKSYFDRAGIATAGKTYTIFYKSALKVVIAVDSQSGDLKVQKRIDRETLCTPIEKPPCRIDFSVYLSSLEKVEVVVIVNDKNDNVPTWKDHYIPVEFKDGDGAGIHKSIPLAVDEDLGQNSSLEYRLQNEGFPFMLQYKKEEGKLYIETSRLIDREEVASYNLTLIAYDNGKPSLTGSTSIIITVKDVNDNAPVFSKTSYSPTRDIVEDEPVDSVILQLEAQDKDSNEYGQVSFKMGSSTNINQKRAMDYFYVTHDGKVKVKQILDYDRMQEKNFVFEVVAHDNAKDVTYRKSSTATVSISIADKIDEKPEIDTCFLPNGCTATAKTPTIMEDIPTGTNIAEVTVFDLDTHDEVTCLVPHDTSQTGAQAKFKLKLQPPTFGRNHYDDQAREKKMYDLVTDGSFDRESRDQECFSIRCEDKLRNFNEKRYCVNIGDINDNPPQAREKIIFHAREEDDRFSPIDGEIRKYVEDKDLGVNKELSFMIDPSDHTSLKLFSINSDTGQLTPKIKFDREKKDTYYLKVIVSDKGTPSLSSTAIVEVRIMDSNDQHPIFTENNYLMQIWENVAANSVVGKVEAKDMDLHSNGNGAIRYRMHSSFSDQEALRAFTLNSETGEIRTRVILDREQNAHYTFSVTAEDQPRSPEPRLTSTATITVEVKDKNDNSPQFVFLNNHDSRIFQVFNKEPGHNIGSVRATDRDDGLNAEITYHLINKHELKDFFDVDPKSGLVLISKTLHGNRMKMFRLQIRACDSGSPKMCSPDTTFTAQITDRIDSLPDNGMNQDHRQGGLKSGGNEAIIICLSIVFVILVVATISLVCLIRRKSVWIKKQRQQANANLHQELEGAEVKMISAPYDLPPCYKDYNLEDDMIYKGGTMLNKKNTDGRSGKRHYYTTTPRICNNVDLMERSPSACSVQQDYQSLESGLRLMQDPNRLYNNSLHMYYEIKQTGNRGDDEDGLQEISEHTTGTLKGLRKNSDSTDGARLCVDKQGTLPGKSLRHYPFSSYTEASFV